MQLNFVLLEDFRPRSEIMGVARHITVTTHRNTMGPFHGSSRLPDLNEGSNLIMSVTQHFLKAETASLLALVSCG